MTGAAVVLPYSANNARQNKTQKNGRKEQKNFGCLPFFVVKWFSRCVIADNRRPSAEHETRHHLFA
jgi:hypothetical protein